MQPHDQAASAAAMPQHSTCLQPSQALAAPERAQERAQGGSQEAGSQVLQHLEARSPNAAAQGNAESMELPEPSPWRVRGRKENSAPASTAKRAKQAEHGSPIASTRLSCSPGRRAAGLPSSPPPHACHAFSQEAAAARAGLRAALRAANVSPQPSTSILPAKGSPCIVADHDRSKAGVNSSSCASPGPAMAKTVSCAVVSQECAPAVIKQRPGRQPAADPTVSVIGALSQQASLGDAQEQGCLSVDILCGGQADPQELQPPDPLPAAGRELAPGQGVPAALPPPADKFPVQPGQSGSAAAAGCESAAAPAPALDPKRGTLSSDAHNAAQNADPGECKGRPASPAPVLGTLSCTEVEVMPCTLVEAAGPSQRRAAPGAAAVHAAQASQRHHPSPHPDALQVVPSSAKAAVTGAVALTAGEQPCGGLQQTAVLAQPTELEVQVSP